MKTMYNERTLADTTRELERIFNVLNQKLFNNELDDIFITIAGGKGGTLGHASKSNFWLNTTRGRYEINMYAEYLTRPIKDTIKTLAHEMVHLYNHTVLNIQDVSGNGYHNKNFKKTCEMIGLLAYPMPNHQQYGCTMTEYIPGGSLEKIFKTLDIDIDCFQFARITMVGGIPTIAGKPVDGKKLKGLGLNYKPQQKTKMLKWSCGCTNIRCAVQLDATCNKCGNTFEKC